MNVHYEEMNNDIKLIHDFDTLDALRDYNHQINKLFYSLLIDNTDDDIFDIFRIFLRYLGLLENVIENQITDTLDDMESSQPADDHYVYSQSFDDH